MIWCGSGRNSTHCKVGEKLLLCEDNKDRRNEWGKASYPEGWWRRSDQVPSGYLWNRWIIRWKGKSQNWIWTLGGGRDDELPEHGDLEYFETLRTWRPWDVQPKLATFDLWLEGSLTIAWPDEYQLEYTPQLDHSSRAWLQIPQTTKRGSWTMFWSTCWSRGSIGFPRLSKM